ncbi:hypothetical protein HN51_026001, partial [Arachis hypogaea]
MESCSREIKFFLTISLISYQFPKLALVLINFDRISALKTRAHFPKQAINHVSCGKRIRLVSGRSDNRLR